MTATSFACFMSGLYSDILYILARGSSRVPYESTPLEVFEGLLEFFPVFMTMGPRHATDSPRGFP